MSYVTIFFSTVEVIILDNTVYKYVCVYMYVCVCDAQNMCGEGGGWKGRCVCVVGKGVFLYFGMEWERGSECNQWIDYVLCDYFFCSRGDNTSW